ncbi:MAG: cysteine desulfurase IscS [Candidatus Parcubacteria bacterium]|nr:MAG: cysteine desulfurase IscS [Candidatus Parcubacteria bacterium]
MAKNRLAHFSYKSRKKIIYLDYASTTPVLNEVFEEMKPYFSMIFANPSSIHSFGQKALKVIDESRQKIKNLIAADYFNEIIFTSSATESNNLVIKGLAFFYYFKLRIKPHFITTEIEHPSIIEPLKDLKKINLIDYDFLPLDKNGLIKLDSIFKFIKNNTCLITIHYVNSEIGIIQPVKKIFDIIKEINKNRDLKILFHLDASQAPLTENISVKDLGVDLMTLSSHKIYGPKGVACLYKKNNIFFEKLISGSEQEFNLRSGTENVPLIVGFAKALEIAVNNRISLRNYLDNLRTYFLNKISQNKINFEINADLNLSTPKIINLYFPQKTAEEILIYLDQNNIFVSSGMACKSRAPLPNEVVTKLYPERGKNSLRFSFGRETKNKDIDYLVNILAKLIKNK